MADNMDELRRWATAEIDREWDDAEADYYQQPRTPRNEQP